MVKKAHDRFKNMLFVVTNNLVIQNKLDFFSGRKTHGCHITQGIFELKKISGKLRKTQEILIFFLTQGSFDFF